MGTAPSHFTSCGPRCPVENVTYADVQKFLEKLNAHTPKTLVYRLPTEAEWEYACRARTTGPFSTGENLTTAQANYNGKYPYGIVSGRRVPAEDDAGRHVSAQPVGPRRHARQRVGVDVGLVRPVSGDDARRTSIRTDRRQARSA